MTQDSNSSAARPGIEMVAPAAGWVLTTLSLVVLTGWTLDLRSLESLGFPGVEMKANTAIALLLIAIALLRRTRRDVPVYASVTILLSALTLAEYTWSINLRIDELIFRDPHFFYFPGRFSQYTAFGLLLLGISILMMRSRQWAVRELSRAIALIAGMLGVLALIAYLYGTHISGRISPHANISVPTALGFAIACAGIHYAHPGEGLVRLLHAPNRAGSALRRMVPAGLVGSVLLGLAVRNAHQVFRWETGFSLALVAAGVTICLMVVIVYTAAGLEKEELARLESELRFRLAANSAPVMIWMSGADKLCSYFNERWLQFTGRALDQEIGNGWAEGVHPDDLAKCLSTYETAFDRREEFQMEYRLRRSDGEYRWLLDTGVPRSSEGAFVGYVGSCIDVTERKTAEEALADLERKLLRAQEDERSRIARELHDDIVQRVAMLTFQLRSIAPRAAADLKTRTSFESIADSMRKLGTDIQAISHRLHSSHLEFLGLAAAASALCKELSAQKQVHIELACEGIPADLSKNVALNLYRVLQEALQNGIKHSGSKRFKVDLRGCGREVQLTVVDTGSGFDPYRADKQQGLGLIGMRERIRMVHGEFVVESMPGRGTTIRCTVPMEPEPLKQAVGRADRLV